MSDRVMEVARLARCHEAEEALVGALLLDASNVDRVGWLEPRDFSDDRLGRIYSAIRAVICRGGPVDPITVKDEMVNTGKVKEGDIEGLAETLGIYASGVARSANVEHYAGLMLDATRRRRSGAEIQLASSTVTAPTTMLRRNTVSANLRA